MFHSQQVVEKSLKALLTWHDVPFRKTHSIEELGRQCESTEPSLRPLVDEAVPLTEYAWKFRYPGEEVQATPEETEEALGIARAVFRAVCELLPAAARGKTP